MFKDFNLKLSIISALHDLGYYEDEVKKISDENDDFENDYVPIPAVLEYYENLEINPEYLSKIESLSPDGGDVVYQYLTIAWDGEDEQFDISSLDGIENLVNLKRFNPVSLISEEGLDYTPLLSCEKLEFANASFIKKDLQTFEIVKKLKAQNVDVQLNEFEIAQDFQKYCNELMSLLEKVENFMDYVNICKRYYEDSSYFKFINFYEFDLDKNCLEELKETPYPEDFIQWHEYYGVINLIIGTFEIKSTSEVVKRLNDFALVLNAHNYLYLTSDESGTIYLYDTNISGRSQIVKMNLIDYYTHDILDEFYLEYYGGCSFHDGVLVNPYSLDVSEVFDEHQNYNIKSLYINKVLQEKAEYVCDTFFELLINKTKEVVSENQHKYAVFNDDINAVLVTHWSYFYNKGIDYYNNKQFELAQIEFIKSIRVKPNAPSYSSLGQIYHKQGKKNEAIESYKKGIDSDCYYCNNHNNLAFLYYKYKDYELAYDTIVSCLLYCFDDGVAHLTKAEICFSLNKIDECYDALECAAVLNEDPRDADQSIENKLKNEPEYRAIMQLYEVGIEDKTIDNEFLENVVVSNKSIQEAINSINEYSNGYYSWKSLGDSLFDIKDYKNCINAFEKARKIGEIDHFDVLTRLAISYGNIEKQQESKYYFHRAVVLNYDTTKGWFNLSKLYFKENNPKKGFHYLDVVLSLNQNLPDLYANYGYYLIFYGQYKEAISFSEKGIIQGNESNSYLNRGHIYLIEGKIEEAISCYVRSYWAFKDSKTFWNDFENDYKAIEQYNISYDYYISLVPKITEQIDNGLLNLKDYSALWSKNISNYDTLLVEDIEALEKLSYPIDFINWIKLGNHCYVLPITNENKEVYNLTLFNSQRIESESAINDYLKNEHYLIFSETPTALEGFFAFDKLNNNRIVSISTHFLTFESIRQKVINEMVLQGMTNEEAHAKLIDEPNKIRDYIQKNLVANSYDSFFDFIVDNSKIIQKDKSKGIKEDSLKEDIEINTVTIKNNLLNFTKNAVEVFLRENSGLQFYAFAYDCNVDFGSVNLCFNTIDGFEDVIKKHYNYRMSTEKKTAIKYNTGDWEYQSFASVDFVTREVLDQIYESFPRKDYNSWEHFSESMLHLFGECLLEFTTTEVYSKIPKTSDFMIFCIDHDEEFERAKERMDKILKK